MITNKQKEINNTLKEMEKTMREKGYLPIVDAHNFLMMGVSLSENFRYMNKSRDKWKEDANKLKEEVKYWKNKYLDIQTKRN